VRVAVERAADEAVLVVSDTGIGISDEFLDRVFDEFRQESEGLTRAHEGSGLGLTITQRLVELMDGAIEAESTKGEGSTFTVRLPLDASSEAAAEAAADRA
jgi:signal transduction histidine kinase